MISSPHVFRFPQLKYVNISYLIFSIIHLFTSYRIIIIIQTQQQLPVGLKAQLVEQCCAITWLWVWAPFKPVFSGLISSQLLKVPRMLIFFRFFLMWLFITKVNLERSAGERLLTLHMRCCFACLLLGVYLHLLSFLPHPPSREGKNLQVHVQV